MRGKLGIKCSSQNKAQDQFFFLLKTVIFSIHTEYLSISQSHSKLLHICSHCLSTLTNPLFLPMTSLNVIFLSKPFLMPTRQAVTFQTTQLFMTSTQNIYYYNYFLMYVAFLDSEGQETSLCLPSLKAHNRLQRTACGMKEPTKVHRTGSGASQTSV